MENNKKRIAVCFYGQVRFLESFNLFYPQLNKLDENITFDYFISTWNDFDHTKINLNFTKQEYLQYDQITKNWEEGHTQKMAYLLSKVGMLKRTYELENDFSYDLVIMIRPDILFDLKLTLKHIQELLKNKEPKPFVSFLDKPYLDADGTYRITADFIFFMSSEAFDIHTTLYNYFYLQKKYKKSNMRYREGGHWIHIFYFLYNNFFMIYNSGIPNCIVRPTRDIEIIREHYSNEKLIAKISQNAKTWNIVNNGIDIEREGIVKSYKDKII